MRQISSSVCARPEWGRHPQTPSESHAWIFKLFQSLKTEHNRYRVDVLAARSRCNLLWKHASLETWTFICCTFCSSEPFSLYIFFHEKPSLPWDTTTAQLSTGNRSVLGLTGSSPHTGIYTPLSGWFALTELCAGCVCYSGGVRRSRSFWFSWSTRTEGEWAAVHQQIIFHLSLHVVLWFYVTEQRWIHCCFLTAFLQSVKNKLLSKPHIGCEAKHWGVSSGEMKSSISPNGS